MSTKLELETELTTIKRRIKEDFLNMQKHYKQKMDYREQIYEE